MMKLIAIAGALGAIYYFTRKTGAAKTTPQATAGTPVAHGTRTSTQTAQGNATADDAYTLAGEFHPLGENDPISAAAQAWKDFWAQGD